MEREGKKSSEISGVREWGGVSGGGVGRGFLLLPQTLCRLAFLTRLTGYRLIQTALDIICLSVSFCYDKIGKLNLKNMNRRGKFLKKLCAASAGSITR